MADVTVTQFADVLKVPVDRLLVQLEQAGITVSGPEDMISDEAKMELLSHLRRSHGTGEDASSPRKITLKRKTQTELKLASTQGRARTVNVEVRVKRTYVKRDVLEEQNRAQQEQADLKRKELEAAQQIERRQSRGGNHQWPRKGGRRHASHACLTFAVLVCKQGKPARTMRSGNDRKEWPLGQAAFAERRPR